ncbi:MAG: hypothetical protein ABFD20_07095 [Anaerolineales bacterium]
MARWPRQKQRRFVARSCAVLLVVLLFLLGLDLADMGLVVLASFYVYWVLRID